MISDDDFQKTINEQAEKRRLQDHTDHQNELAGRSTGRMYRFHPGDKPDGTFSESKNRHSETALHLLMQDSEYAKAYNDTMDLLARAEAATEKALTQAEKDLALTHEQLKDMRERASKLPDGTAVFWDTDDNAWTEDDRLVDEQEAQSIVRKENAPTREEHLKEKQKAEDGKLRIEELRRYQVDVLGHARDRLQDKDNPSSKDEIDTIKEDILKYADPTVRAEIKPDIQSPKADTEITPDIPTPVI